MYSRIAPYYDLIASRWEKKALLKALEMLGAQPEEKILDIGCGTGPALIFLSHAVGPTGKIYGLDASEHMLAIAEKKIKKSSRENVFLSTGSALSLPYPTKTFDAILMTFFLEIFSEETISKILYECKRVLKPRGRICILSLSSIDQETGTTPLSVHIYTAAHNLFPSIIDCKPIDLQEIIRKNNLNIITTKNFSLFTLPVTAVVAQ